MDTDQVLVSARFHHYSPFSHFTPLHLPSSRPSLDPSQHPDELIQPAPQQLRPSSDNRLSQGSDDLVRTSLIKKAPSTTDLLGLDFWNYVTISSSSAKQLQLTLPTSNTPAAVVSFVSDHDNITSFSTRRSNHRYDSYKRYSILNSETPRCQTVSRSTASGASTSSYANSTCSTAVASGWGSGPSPPVQSRTGGSSGAIRSGGSGSGSGGGLDPPPSMRQMGNSSSPHGSNGSSTRYTGGPAPANTRSRRAKKCQPGQHTYKYQYGARGLVCSIVYVPPPSTSIHVSTISPPDMAPADPSLSLSSYLHFSRSIHTKLTRDPPISSQSTSFHPNCFLLGYYVYTVFNMRALAKGALVTPSCPPIVLVGVVPAFCLGVVDPLSTLSMGTLVVTSFAPTQ
ncbi:hypothetical protein DL93DRAFT_2174255 [Clavulina sp. PMI_390]|nr:hypothetical protein DL93DRAFT_2174255 [Clavulina sp. PMI_390]